MTRWHFLGATALALLIVAPPVAFEVKSRTAYRNFHQVDAGKLYRSGQMTPATFARILREYRIGTVFSLRDTRDDSGMVTAGESSRRRQRFRALSLAPSSPGVASDGRTPKSTALRV